MRMKLAGIIGVHSNLRSPLSSKKSELCNVMTILLCLERKIQVLMSTTGRDFRIPKALPKSFKAGSCLFLLASQVKETT